MFPLSLELQQHRIISQALILWQTDKSRNNFTFSTYNIFYSNRI